MDDRKRILKHVKALTKTGEWVWTDARELRCGDVRIVVEVLYAAGSPRSTLFVGDDEIASGRGGWQGRFISKKWYERAVQNQRRNMARAAALLFKEDEP